MNRLHLKQMIKYLFLLLCICSASLLIIGYLYIPGKSVILTERLHAGVCCTRNLDCRLYLTYNTEFNTPYNPDNVTENKVHTTHGFNFIPGIYYHHIKSDYYTNWICLFSLWYPIAIFGLLFVSLYVHQIYYNKYQDNKKSSRSKDNPSYNHDTSN
jgi:hypothetical protein